MLFVDLFGFEGFFVDGQCDGEDGALAQFALTVDGAFVQVDEIAGESQSHASADGALLVVVAHKESIEEVI